LEKPTKTQFEQWVNDSTTCYIRNLLAEQAQNEASLNFSLSDQMVNDEGEYSLERLGLDAAVKMAVVKGICYFTDTNSLRDALDFEEGEDERI
jgi:hypothetical protein